MQNIDWTPIIAQLLLLMVPILLAAASKALYNIYHTKLKAEQRSFIENVVRQAVLMAEQVGLTAVVEDLAKAKKNTAIQWAQHELDANHIKVDVTTLSGLIEAAVFTEFNRWKTSWPEPPEGDDLPGTAAAVQGNPQP